MKVKDIIPTAPEVLREFVIVGLGVLLWTVVVSQWPDLKKFIKENNP